MPPNPRRFGKFRFFLPPSSLPESPSLEFLDFPWTDRTSLATFLSELLGKSFFSTFCTPVRPSVNYSFRHRDSCVCHSFSCLDRIASCFPILAPVVPIRSRLDVSA